MKWYGKGGTTQLPIGGWYLCFPWVKSGWLSKFWCIPVLFQMVFGFLNGLDITGCHLLDTQQLDSSVHELRPEHSQRSLVPVPLGCYNVHNVLAGSNIFIWGCSVGPVVFLNPKPK